MENNNVELFLYVDDVWKQIELNNNVPFPVTLSIADIKDISKRNTTFSKTIEVPGTKDSNNVFYHIFDIANYSRYNSNKKVKCTVVVDTVPVIQEAFFQLTDIRTDDNLHFVYECVIFGDTDSIIKEMGNNLLSDMNCPELEHTYNNLNIVNSWNSNYTNGYYYPLVDYGYNWDTTKLLTGPTAGARIEEMRTAIYAKYLWNKIFSEAGWTYESSFINATNSIWNDMIILGGTQLKQNATFSYYNSFRSQLNSDNVRTSIGDQLTYVNSGPGYKAIINTGVTSSIVTGLGWDDPTKPGFYQERLPMNDDVNSPNGDSSNLWDIYVSRSGSGYTNAGKYVPLNLYALPGSSNGGWPICEYTISPSSFRVTSYGYNYIIPGDTITKQFNTPIFDQSSGPCAKLQPGEKVWFKLVSSIYFPIWNGYSTIASIGPSFSYTLNSNSFVYNYVSGKLIPNQPINGSSMMPKNFKQIDFFNSMVKMFNLYIEPDKNIPKRLKIETRDIYYNSGVEKDWTNKVDISKEIKQQLIAESQAKELLLTYKLDKDAYNDNYFNNTKEVYGAQKYIVDNDFIKGTNKIEISFASTPIAPLQGNNSLSSDVIKLPVIAKNDNGLLKPTEFI